MNSTSHRAFSPIRPGRRRTPPLVKRPLLILLLLAALLFGFVIWRVQGIVLAEAKVPQGVGVVTVRKVFWHPWSIGALLGQGESFIRADYRRHSGGPIYSSFGHYGESFYPKTVEIHWSTSGHAEVIMDGVAYMHLSAENWLWPKAGKTGPERSPTAIQHPAYPLRYR